jgi:hypothetical protein
MPLVRIATTQWPFALGISRPKDVRANSTQEDETLMERRPRAHTTTLAANKNNILNNMDRTQVSNGQLKRPDVRMVEGAGGGKVSQVKRAPGAHIFHWLSIDFQSRAANSGDPESSVKVNRGKGTWVSGLAGRVVWLHEWHFKGAG